MEPETLKKEPEILEKFAETSKSQHKRICIQSKCAVRDELQEQLEQKNKQLDRQEAAIFRLKEHDSYQRARINRLEQKIEKGNKLKARNEKLINLSSDLVRSINCAFKINEPYGQEWQSVDDDANLLNEALKLNEVK